MSASGPDGGSPPVEQTGGSPPVEQTDEKLSGQVADSESAIGHLPKWYKRAMPVTLVVDGVTALCLAFRDYKLETDPVGPLFAAMLLAIGFINLLSVYSMLAKLASWQIQTIVAQALFALLALYVVAKATQVPQQLPGWRWLVVGAFVLLGISAVVWILLVVGLGALKEFHWTKEAWTAIVALVPLSGLVTFWLQSDYLPKVTDPLVDVSAELTPIGRLTPTGGAGSIDRLSAKVTFHNRGAAKVYIAGALMRVTAYPYPAGPEQAASPDNLQQQLHMWTTADSVFRASPMFPAEAKLLYAEDLEGYPWGAYLFPGQTLTNQREVDVNSKDVRLARLTAFAVFFTDRQIRKIKTHPESDTNHTGNWAIDYYIAPRSAIQEIIAGDAVLRVQLLTRDLSGTPGPTHEVEYPRLDYWMCTTKEIGEANSDEEPPCNLQQIVYNNPVNSYEVWAEYAPTDHETDHK